MRKFTLLLTIIISIVWLAAISQEETTIRNKLQNRILTGRTVEEDSQKQQGDTRLPSVNERVNSVREQAGTNIGFLI